MAANRIAMLKSYLLEDPGDTFSRYALALEYIRSGNEIEAEMHMEHLYRQHPDYLANYYHYGKLLERKGENELALKVYQYGIELCKQKNDQHTMNELRGAIDNLDSANYF